MPVAVGLVRLIGLRALGKQAEAQLIARAQLLCGLLDLLIGILPLPLLQGFDELVHLALRFFLLGFGQEHACLDVHEVGRHGDELAGDLHIHPLHFIQIGQILLQNGGDLDILDLYFIFAQQQEDDVQRAVKILQRLAFRVYDAAEVVSRFIHAVRTPKVNSAQRKQQLHRPGADGFQSVQKSVAQKFQRCIEYPGQKQECQKRHAVALIAHQPVIRPV